MRRTPGSRSVPVPGLDRLLFLAIAVASLTGCGENGITPRGETDGNHLVVSASDRNRAAGDFDLYLYDLDAQAFRALVNANSSSPDLNPSITSDGGFIAFQSDRGGPAGSDLYLYNRNLAGLVAIPGANSDSDETEPVFTDNALRLAFVREVLGFKRIRLLDGLGDTLVALPGLDTTGTFNDWAPSPNVNGNIIAFVSDRHGTPDVFVWERGVGVRDIPALRSDSVDTEPSLSGDGRYLYFASSRTGGKGGFDIYVHDFNLSSTSAVDSLNTPAHERNPSSSRTGDVVVIESNRAGGLGKLDIWNHDVGSGRTGQGTEQSSTADDIQPTLRWR